MSRRRARSSRSEGHHESAGDRCDTTGTGRETSSKQPPKDGASTASSPLRMAVFGAVVVAVVAAAAFVLVDRLQGPPTLDQTAIQVSADMGGFTPGDLTVAAGETVRIEFASLDTPYHNDGGGWHQFAIDELGIDWQVGPKSSQVFSFQAPSQPGSYDFYCDICCGGKQNPNMQGTLTVAA